MRRIIMWVQVFTAMGVIIGIGLVILQLQQNAKLSRFQIATDLRLNRDNDRNVIKGEQFSTTLAKLQTTPQAVTDAELIQFDAHARSLASELHLRRVLADVGIFEGDWTGWLEAESCDLFNNPIGRAWLKVQRQTTDDGVIGAMNQDILEELERRSVECDNRSSFLKFVREKQTQ